MKFQRTLMLLIFIVASLLPGVVWWTSDLFAQGDLPPLLIDSSPADGEEWKGDPVRLVFDQPLSEDAVDHLSIRPSVAGNVTLEGSVLTFTPSAPEAIEPGERYRLLLDTLTTSAAGVPLSAAVSVALVGETPLEISSIQPRSERDVGVTTPIVVVFNQPVVPLQDRDTGEGLPSPLTIEPAVDGAGRWLNTSVYSFEPNPSFAGNTEYVISIGDLESFEGKRLVETQRFTFTTEAPAVVSVTPTGEQVSPDAVIQIEFNQPMQRESTEAAFMLSTNSSEGDLQTIAGEYGWNANSTTLTFTPTQALAMERYYWTQVSTEALSVSNAPLFKESTSQFRTLPLPKVESISPKNGADSVDPEDDVTLRFNVPLSRSHVLEYIQVTPLLSSTQIYSSYNEYDNSATLSWPKEPNTVYTITVGSAILDPYGNPLGDEFSSSFTTGDYQPWIRTNLENFTHFSAYTTTQVGVLYRNVESIEAQLFRLPLEHFFRFTGDSSHEVWGKFKLPVPDLHRVWTRSFTDLVERNQTGQKVIPLLDDSGKRLTPGIYLLEVELPKRSPTGERLDQKVIVISNAHLTVKKGQEGESLAWVTDLQSGKPVADAPVQFWIEGALKGETHTNVNGVATLPLELEDEESWRGLVGLAGKPGESNFAAASTRWNEGIGVWEFGLSSGFFRERYLTHFYTERPIYRPGQTVYWKGIIRARAGNEYQLPPTELPITIDVYDGQGNILQSETFHPNAHGTIHGQIELDAEATTGFYNINIQTGPEAPQIYGGTNFQVAAYRKPEFEIELTTDRLEYRDGDTVQATLEARYFSGGPLSGADVTWRILAEPFNFTWDDQPTGRYFNFTTYNPDEDAYDPFRGSSFGGVVREGSGKLGPDGKMVIAVPADLRNSLSSQRWIIDATVQSSTNQFVSANAGTIIHKSDFYIGVSPQRYVIQRGDESRIDLVTLTPEQTFYPDADLEVTIQEFKWNSVYEKGPDGYFYWRSEVERTPIFTTTVRTGSDGTATFSWTPTTGGSFQVVARSPEEPVSGAAFVYVSDPSSFVAWPRENHDRIELVADKEIYDVGDVAQILVPSPFTDPVTALVTLERGGVLESEVITLNSNSHTLEVPITADHIPNVFLSVLLVKGVDETNEYPAMRIGYVQLQVDTAEKELTLEVDTSQPEVQPGELVSYTVSVRDAFSQPVANSEVSVALVDKAIFTLSNVQSTPLIDIYYSLRALGVETGALLNINQDRLSQQLTEGTKGGGGGDGSGLEIRGDFRDVAFWRADLVTDEKGQLHFSVDLPDNLTTWRLVVRTVSDETLVGEIEHDLVATKRLQMRTLLPRFFAAGDKAQIGAALLNASPDNLSEGRLVMSVTGATIEGQSVLDDLSLPAGAETRHDWVINVEPDSESVNLVFAAEVGDLSDGVSVEIPVKRFVTRETFGTAGAVVGSSRVEAVRAPANAQGSSDLIVQLEPSLAAGMLDSLDYLEHYEYECNEQTVSRFLPNLFTVRALHALDRRSPTLEAALDRQLEIAIQRLMNRQNPDGGWGFWPTQESTPFVSTYVLWGLIHAQSLGRAVPLSTIERAVDYLENQFRAPDNVSDAWRLNEMAFMHFVLTEAGAADPGRASTLFDARDGLQNYGKAFLAMALGQMAANEDGSYTPGADPRIETLLDSLFGAAQLTATGTYWIEPEIDFRTLNTNIRTTAIVLAAFSRLAPDDPMLPSVVRWLMDAREAGRWPSTQENAWSLIALTDWMQTSRELEADYAWEVSLNGESLGSGTFNERTVVDQVELQAEVDAAITEQAQRLQIERDNDSGQLYYTIYMRSYLDALDVEARNRGIIVSRRVELAGQAVESVQVGDVVTVTVAIVAPTDLHHVLIEAPIPAGMEPIDPNLATESQVFEDPGQVTDQAYFWYWWSPDYVDVRDDKVAFFATFLQSGTYEYRFQARATVPGEYRVWPVYAEQMYFPEVWGRGEASLFTIVE